MRSSHAGELPTSATSQAHAGFAGEIWAVNPDREPVQVLKARLSSIDINPFMVWAEGKGRAALDASAGVAAQGPTVSVAL